MIQGEDFSKALAKLHSAPESLTDEELHQFQAHARSLVSELDMRRVWADVGIFESDWRVWLQPETCDLLDNSVGRVWVETLKEQQVWDSTRGTVPNRQVNDELLVELERRLGECPDRPSFMKSVRRNQVQ